MTDLVRAMAASASGMTAQASRLRLTAENLANADTPGYRRKLIPFEAVMDGSGVAVRTGPVRLFDGELPKIHDPSHPLADAEGYYEGSSVNSVIEIADAREASRSYEANLRLLDQARDMTRGLIDVLRR
jgi:flagellar basal-body rod protein FlgC